MRDEIARALDGTGIELELSAGYPLGKAVPDAEPEDFWIGFRQPGFGDLWLHQGMFVLFLEALRCRRRHRPGDQLCIRDLIDLGNQVDVPDGSPVNDYEIPPELDMTPEQFAIFMNEIKAVGQIKVIVEQMDKKIDKLPTGDQVAQPKSLITSLKEFAPIVLAVAAIVGIAYNGLASKADRDYAAIVSLQTAVSDPNSGLVTKAVHTEDRLNTLTATISDPNTGLVRQTERLDEKLDTLTKQQTELLSAWAMKQKH